MEHLEETNTELSKTTESEGKPWPSLPEKQRIREVTLIVGKTGCGKSYFLKNYLKQFNRVILLDCLGEHDGYQQFDNRFSLIEYCIQHKIFRVSTQESLDFPNVCHLAMGLTKCCVAIEESQRFFPAKGFIDPYFAEIIYRGRHRAVSVIMIAQRASSINIIPRSQWTKIITFQQTDKNDTSWLRGDTGYDLPELEKLNIGEYYEITPHSEKLIKSIDKK